MLFRFFVSQFLILTLITASAQCPPEQSNSIKTEIKKQAVGQLTKIYIQNSLYQSIKVLPKNLATYVEDISTIWKIKQNQKFILTRTVSNIVVQGVVQFLIVHSAGSAGLISVDFLVTLLMALIVNTTFLKQQAKPILGHLKKLEKSELVLLDLKDLLEKRYPKNEAKTLLEKIKNDYSKDFLTTLGVLAVTDLLLDTFITMQQLNLSGAQNSEKNKYVSDRFSYNALFLFFLNLKLVAITTILYALNRHPKIQLLTSVIDRLSFDILYFYLRDEWAAPPSGILLAQNDKEKGVYNQWLARFSKLKGLKDWGQIKEQLENIRSDLMQDLIAGNTPQSPLAGLPAGVERPRAATQEH